MPEARQKGLPEGPDLQSCQMLPQADMAAEAKTKIDVTNAFIDQCVAELEAGALDPAKAAMVKWWASQVQCEIADECLQLFGGYGYMDEYPISRLFADARVQKIYGGANEMMKELIARSM